jgi:hypothetical protein
MRTTPFLATTTLLVFAGSALAQSDCPPFPGSAIRLDGGWMSGVWVPDDPALDLGMTATVEGWFRPSDPFLGNRILSKGDGWDGQSDRMLDLYFFPATGAVYGEFFTGPIGAGTSQIILGADNLMRTNEWHHFAFTLDINAPAARLYIDGALRVETSLLPDGVTPIPPIPLRDSSQPLILGAVYPFAFSACTLDEVRIWNVARTTDEIAASWRTLVGPGTPGLVACYRLDEGEGVIAHDLKGSHDGNLLGAAAWVATTPCCPADFNADGFLDFFDYLDYVTCFEGSGCPSGTDADFNRDGFADFFDYMDFVAAFETGC